MKEQTSESTLVALSSLILLVVSVAVWPDDRCWVVSTDVDEMTTYMSAVSREAIRQVLTATELEALEVPVGHTQRYIEDSENDTPESLGWLI
jgi:hypothetical protein